MAVLPLAAPTNPFSRRVQRKARPQKATVNHDPRLAVQSVDRLGTGHTALRQLPPDKLNIGSASHRYPGPVHANHIALAICAIGNQQVEVGRPAQVFRAVAISNTVLLAQCTEQVGATSARKAGPRITVCPFTSLPVLVCAGLLSWPSYFAVCHTLSYSVHSAGEVVHSANIATPSSWLAGCPLAVTIQRFYHSL